MVQQGEHTPPNVITCLFSFFSSLIVAIAPPSSIALPNCRITSRNHKHVAIALVDLTCSVRSNGREVSISIGLSAPCDCRLCIRVRRTHDSTSKAKPCAPVPVSGAPVSCEPSACASRSTHQWPHIMLLPEQWTPKWLRETRRSQ